MTTETKRPTLEDIEEALNDAESTIEDAMEAIPEEVHDPYDLETASSAIDDAVRFLNEIDTETAERQLRCAKESVEKLRHLVGEYVSGGIATAEPKPEFRWTLPEGQTTEPLVASACQILEQACHVLAETLDNVNTATSDDGRVGGLIGVNRVITLLTTIEGCVAARQLTR